MKKRINITAASALILLLFSIGVLLAIPRCIKEYSAATDIGPRAFPLLICITIAVLCTLQLVLLALKIEKGSYMEFSPAAFAPVFGAMGLAVVAVAAVRFVNVLVAGVVCAEALLLLLRARDWRYYLSVALTGGALFFLMRQVMHIRF